MHRSCSQALWLVCGELHETWLRRDVPLPGTPNQKAKIPQVPPAPSWLRYQATFLAHVKQFGIITVTESKQEEQQMYKDKQID